MQLKSTQVKRHGLTLQALHAAQRPGSRTPHGCTHAKLDGRHLPRRCKGAHVQSAKVSMQVRCHMQRGQLHVLYTVSLSFNITSIVSVHSTYLFVWCRRACMQLLRAFWCSSMPAFYSCKKPDLKVSWLSNWPIPPSQKEHAASCHSAELPFFLSYSVIVAPLMADAGLTYLHSRR